MIRIVTVLIFTAFVAGIQAQMIPTGIDNINGFNMKQIPCTSYYPGGPCIYRPVYYDPQVYVDSPQMSISDLLVQAISWVAQSTYNTIMMNMSLRFPLILKIVLFPMIVLFQITRIISGIIELPWRLVRNFLYKNFNVDLH